MKLIKHFNLLIKTGLLFCVANIAHRAIATNSDLSEPVKQFKTNGEDGELKSMQRCWCDCKALRAMPTIKGGVLKGHF